VTYGPRGGAEPSRWNQLLDVALEVFQEKGYERASVADVAKAAGLAKPTLYHYIDSKEDLLYGILSRSHQRLTAQLAALEPRDSALEMVRQVVQTHVLFNIQYRDETAVFLADSRMLSEERRQSLNELLDEYDRRLQALVEEAQRRGEISSTIDPALAVLAMLGAANFVSRWYRQRPGSNPSHIAEVFADLAIGGLLGINRAPEGSQKGVHA